MAKKETRHVSKFMGGQMTPQEAHRALGIRKKCELCGDPGAIRIRVLMPLIDFIEKHPQMATAIMETNPNGRTIPTVGTKYGKMVKVEDFGACDRCKASAEKMMAQRFGDSVIVDIDRGPADSMIVQVPGAQ